MKKFLKIVLTIIFILFGYGLTRGIYDANFNSKSSLLSLGLTANAMNPIGAFGYRLGIHTNPEIQKRIQNFQNKVDTSNNIYD